MKIEMLLADHDPRHRPADRSFEQLDAEADTEGIAAGKRREVDLRRCHAAIAAKVRSSMARLY
jgi:hypothetical protein